MAGRTLTVPAASWASAFVRASVKQKLSESEARTAQGSVLELAGKYRSGQTDLAENHDGYLNDGW
jgi:hypothetical protein